MNMKKFLTYVPLEVAVLVAFLNSVFLTINFIWDHEIVVGIGAEIFWILAFAGYRILHLTKKTNWEVFLEKATKFGAVVVRDTGQAVTIEFNAEHSEDIELLAKKYAPGLSYRFVEPTKYN